MTGIDIGLFDFDRHNALYYFILNADERIYMRYGGRDATASDAYLDLNSLEIALRKGLELHAESQAGRLAKKTRPAPFFPRDIPSVRREVLGRGRCVECHLIADYQAQELEAAGRLDKIQDMYVSPDINRLGLFLDKPAGLVVRNTMGAVETAGMRPGDLVTAVDGAPVFTFGDLQYVYNKVPRGASRLALTVNRRGRDVTLDVQLPMEWWRTNLYFRYWSVEPVLFFVSRSLSEREKGEHGLEVDGFAAEVINVYRKARQNGLNELEPGDIVFSVEGTEADPRTRLLEAYIALSQTAGSRFTVEVIRKGERMELPISTFRQRFRK